ncbi:MAG: TetR family transcriptional regulator C-terminal domain-containing protein [Mesorhizobium sp.]|nr:TetR/AcrR family transcriptional regulator [Mesorhizobium sp.]MBL8580133.1 TetR family transcriptional regulator C-terminal domain-containing protein [Mesorhizobium sp.]
MTDEIVGSEDDVAEGSPELPRKRGKSRRSGNLHVAARTRAVAKILKAGEVVFGRRGFDGATTAEIAREAGVAKATLHYYFKTKEDLHRGVLDRLHFIWESALNEITPEATPAEAMGRYIAAKMRATQEHPELTRLWALEVLSGGGRVADYLRERTRRIVEQKSIIMNRWIAEGRMDPIDPYHVIFSIWAMTQTYAETESQIVTVMDTDGIDEEMMRRAAETISHVMLKGLGLKA